MKLVKKSISKFLKDFGKMEIIDKIMLIVDRLSASDKPLHQVLLENQLVSILF